MIPIMPTSMAMSRMMAVGDMGRASPGGGPMIIGPPAANQFDQAEKQTLFIIVSFERGSNMGISEQIQKDMVDAMRGREELRLSTLRMVKAAIKNKEIDKRAPLDEKEAQQVLATLIKQRRDSIEQFQKGGRQELADKEAAEIKLIEVYLPKAMGEEEIAAAVKSVIAEMGSPTMKDIGAVMKNAMTKLQATGARVEGKTVSEIVKKQLGG